VQSIQTYLDLVQPLDSPIAFRDVASKSKTNTTGEPKGPKNSLRAAQREFTRSFLIRAAVEVFDEKGYANATIDEIVTRATTTRTTFYMHFTGKRDVILAIQEENEKRNVRGLLSPGTIDPTPEAIRAWLEGVTDYWLEHRADAKAIHQAASEDAEIQARLLDDYHRGVEAITRQLSARPEGPPPHVETRAFLLLCQIRQFYSMWILEQSWEVDRDEALTALTEIWVDALGGAGAKAPPAAG
jgi:AcrR family transcriptional regulator